MLIAVGRSLTKHLPGLIPAPWARVASLAVLVSLLILPKASAINGREDNWVATWGVSPQSATESIFGTPPTPVQFNNQTIRMIARISQGGGQVRIRLDNRFGTDSLVIGAAHIAMHSDGAEIEPGSDRTLLFGNSSSITIPPGASAVSDPVRLRVPDLTELAVSLYLPNPTSAVTVHSVGAQTAYFSAAGAGDITDAITIPTPTTALARYFLSGIDVRTANETKAIITLGDSITDGVNSTVDANRRWPDRLAERLLDQRGLPELSVVNEGISGNRLLHNIAGPNVLSRFDHDVLAQTNAEFVVTLVGINDIGFSAIPNPNSPFAAQAVSAEDMIQAYRQIISRAHSKGLKIIGGTLLPFEGAGYFSAEGEAKRQAVNAYIRHGGDFDGVIDFDCATRDPSQPTKLLPLYDSGDHLHPNDAGYEAMANAVDLRLFVRHRSRD